MQGRGENNKERCKETAYSETRVTSLVILNTVELDMAHSDSELLPSTNEMKVCQLTPIKNFIGDYFISK